MFLFIDCVWYIEDKEALELIEELDLNNLLIVLNPKETLLVFHVRNYLVSNLSCVN